MVIQRVHLQNQKSKSSSRLMRSLQTFDYKVYLLNTIHVIREQKDCVFSS